MKREKLQKMYNQLDEWIDIGIADDILNAEMRPEFQSFVKEQRDTGISDIDIPQKVLWDLREQIQKIEAEQVSGTIDNPKKTEERVVITVGAVRVEIFSGKVSEN